MVIIHKQKKGAAPGKEPTCYKIHIQGAAVKAAARRSAAGRGGARNAGDGAQVAFLTLSPQSISHTTE